MSTTQKHLSIGDIKDDIVLLKDAGAALVLQVSAVNFGLLSEREQIAIISSFAQMLNSLSFSIQIVIMSERLNIGSYLNLLDQAQKGQNNPLLSALITSYKQFIQTTIKENDVLDKKFYIIIPLSKLELGIIPTKEALHQKVKTVLLPRRDQIFRQLNRVGLKAIQLSSGHLLELFFNIYNGGGQQFSPPPPPVKLNAPNPITPTSPPAQPEPSPEKPTSQNAPPTASQPARTHPFVVEELEE